MFSIHHNDVQVLLDTIRPSSVLLIDPHPEAWPAQFNEMYPHCRVTRLADDAPAQLPTLGHFDLGIVANTLEYLDQRTAGSILARLRDIHTGRFVALVPLGEDWNGAVSHWQATDLLAYGMTRMTSYRVDDKPLQLFHYAIESYKTTPEWFNSRDWANPRRWKP